MSGGMDPATDILTLHGLGGLFNGETFVLKAGESGTIGATSLATFPVTICRNFRRLEGDPSREEILTRLAPEHVRFVYVGGGRLVIENLPGRDVRVGWRAVDGRTEVDLGKGRVEVGFGYGERVVASCPASPADFQEFAAPPDETAAVEGVFMALLEPGGELSGIAARAARRLAEEEERSPYALEDEDPEDVDPERDTGPIPEISLPPERPRRRRRWNPFRSGPALLLSILLHLVVVLGLFAWVRWTPPPEPEPSYVTVKVARTPAAAVAEPPAESEVPDAAAAAAPAPAPLPADVHADPSERLAGGPESDTVGAGDPGILGIGAGGPDATGGPTRAAGIGPASSAVTRGATIDTALAWLARHQRPDGAWGAITSLASDDCEDPGHREYPVATTGLALLAFAGAGHTHRTGDHRRVVGDGVRWLIGRQREDGSFAARDAVAGDRPVYGDAIAVFGLAETYRLSRSPLVRGALVRGVHRLVEIQTPYAGWRYLPGARDSDTSVTGWVGVALVAAGRAGIEVNPAVRSGILSWLEAATDPVSFRVGYRERGRGSPGMTATGLALRLLLDVPAADPAVRGGAEILDAALPAWPEPPGRPAPGNPPDLLAWYFGAIAAANRDRAAAEEWFSAVRTALEPRQSRRGETKGSFPPVGRWTRVGGRVVSTALATMTLEIAHRSPTAFR